MVNEYVDSAYMRMLGGAFIVCIIALSSNLHAQDGSPIILGEREDMQFFQFERIRASLEGYYRSHSDNSTDSSGIKTKNTETLFRETLTLDTEGFFGNPNLVRLDLNFNIRLSQEDIDSNTLGTNSKTSETVNEYDVSALILQKSDTPLTVYSRRSQVLLDRQFANSLDSINIEHGARLVLRSDYVPTQIHFFHREQEQSGRLGGIDSKITQDTLAWQGRIRPVNGHSFWWDYAFSNVEENGIAQAPNSYDRHDVIVNHVYNYGSDAKHTLRSSLRIYKETGNFPIDRLRLNESLRLLHSPNFETKYTYMYDQQERRGIDQTTNRSTASFRHDLFDSLTTTGQIGASVLDITQDNFKSEQYFGDVGLNYTKKVPYGVLDATVNFNFNRQVDSARGASIFLTDVSYNFGVSGLFEINRRNIIASSIVVTDPTGFVTYTEGVDYTVQVLSNSIEIIRVLGGGIPVSESVLVTAEVGPEPANTTDTKGVGFTTRYRIDEGPLKGLSPYFRFRDQSQDRDAVSVITLPQNDFQDLTMGLDYRLGKLSLLVEHQNHDSSISPFDRTRVEGRYTSRFGARSVVLLSAYFQETDRQIENLQNQITNVTARWTSQPTNRWRSSVVGIWRHEKDNVGTNSNAYELAVDLTWQYRQTTVYCTLRNSIIKSNTRDTDIQTIAFGVRRVF